MRVILLLILYLFSNLNLQAQDLVELKEGWQVVHGKLLSPGSFPEDAPEGRLPERTPYGTRDGFPAVSTWRLRLQLGGQQATWGIIVPDIFTAYHLFLNGHPVGGLGIVSETRGGAQARVGRKEYYAFSRDGVLEIVLQVSNYEVEGDKIRSPLLLGSAQAVATKRIWDTATDIVIIIFLLLAGMAMLTLPELFYVFSSKMLGAFFLVLALRFGVMGERLLTALLTVYNFEVVSDMGYVTASLAAVFLVLSLASRFRETVDRGLSGVVVGVNILAILLVVLIPTAHFPPWSNIFDSGLGLAVVWILLLPLGLLLRRVPMNALYWLSLASIPVTTFLDMLVFRGMLRGVSSLPLGILIFTVGQVAAVAIGNTRSEREERRLLEEFQKAESSRISFLDQYQHHLRTPLHGLLAYLERIPDDDPEKAQALRLHSQMTELRNAVNDGLEGKGKRPPSAG